MGYDGNRTRRLEIIMGHIWKSILAASAGAFLVAGFAGLAEAGSCKGRQCKRYSDEPGVYRYVTTNSIYHGTTASAPVRQGRWGDEVRIGSNWVHCEITCEYTLRRLTVDFWEGMGNGHIVTPGYFTYEADLDTGEVYRRGPRVLGRY